MTDVATPAAPPVAAPPPPPVAPAPVVVAAPAPPPAAPVAADADPGDGSLPKWVAARLEQAKRSAAADVLRAIGADTTDAAADAVKRARAAAEAEKTAAQQAADATARAAVLQKERDEYHGTISTYATAQLSALTPEQRTAVTTLAGDSPAAQLRAIEALRATWAAPAAAPVAAPPPPAPVPPPPLAAPANTAPTAGAPPAGAPPAVVDHLAVHADYEKTNPVRAARYRTTYAGEIAAATKARGSK